mgnify:FL=1
MTEDSLKAMKVDLTDEDAEDLIQHKVRRMARSEKLDSASRRKALRLASRLVRRA